MKKLTTVLLGLSLALGTVAFASPQDTATTTTKKKSKTKKTKKKSDTTEKKGGSL